MQSFDIVKRNEVNNASFRVSKVRSDFDIRADKIEEHFKGEINIPDKWNIGLIVGGSGTGKSTIAKEIWGGDYVNGYEYNSACVIDDMPPEASVTDITKMFYAVGFGSVPSWLKPYSVLSNGERMRVDLARTLLAKNFAVFDEFTSVVDRQVAKVASIAVNKAVKRQNKKIILISCHYDIIEWLQPDWIFDTNRMQNFFASARDRNNPLTSEGAISESGQSLKSIII